MEAESSLLLVARAIDEKIKYMETKLEKPYLIGFNHNNTPAQEAEKILNNFMKEVDEMTDEQQEIEKFLEEEIKEVQARNEDYKKFLQDGQAQLEEMEKYACNNVPGYKKFVPPSPPAAVDDNHYVLTSPSDLPMTLLNGPNDRDEISPEQEEEDNIPPEDLADHLDNEHEIKQEEGEDEDLYRPEEELFQDDSQCLLVPDESRIELVSSPIMDDIKPVVAKKLDFDQLTSVSIKGQPMACSTERKSKTPVEAIHKKRALQKQSEDIENLSGIQDIGGANPKQPPPPSSYQSKPTRKILTERQTSDHNHHRSVETNKQTRDKETYKQSANHHYNKESANHHYNKESANHYNKEFANHYNKESANHYNKESANHYNKESANHYNKESANSYNKESANSYNKESANHYNKESANHYNKQNSQNTNLSTKDYIIQNREAEKARKENRVVNNKDLPSSYQSSLNNKELPSSHSSSKDLPPSFNSQDFLASLSNKYFPTSTNFRRDTLTGRSDPSSDALRTLGARNEAPSDVRRETLSNNLRRDTLGRKDFALPGLSDVLRRDTLSGKTLPSGVRRDTLTGRILPGMEAKAGGERRETFGGRKDLPSGLRDGYSRDTFGGKKDLPTCLRDGFSARDTFGGRKDLPTGLREGYSSRDTFGGRKDLPTGLRDGYSRDTFGGARDTVTGDVISSRRLSHYRAVPKMRLGTLPSPPKEPVTSEFGLKMIGRLK